MTQLMIMTAEEWMWRVCFWLVIVGFALCVVGGVIEEIVLRNERKKEEERRALKRYNAPIRPAHRR
jgi:hypothetical protein